MAKRRRKREGWPRVYRRDNGYWYAEWKRGRPESLKTRDQETAFRKVEIQVELRKKGKLLQLDKVKRIRLSEFRDEYVRERERQLDMGEIVESTLRADRLALDKLIGTAGDIPLRQVTARVVDDFKAKLLGGAKDPVKRMNGINVHIRHLRSAFNWATIEDGDRDKQPYINKNPFAKERGRRPVEFYTGQRLPRFLEVPEIAALRKVITEKIAGLQKKAEGETGGGLKLIEKQFARWKDIRNLFEFFLHTGMRRSELVALEWRDIKFELNVVHIRRAKRKKERTVPISPRLRQVIEAMGVKDIGPVFPRWRSADSVSRLFNSLASKAGVEKTLHSTRHSFGSHALMSGIDLRTIQEYMGHESISTTQIYAKVSEEHKQTEIRKLRFGAGDEEEL